jgi:hypothetical protein
MDGESLDDFVDFRLEFLELDEAGTFLHALEKGYTLVNRLKG